MSYGRGDGVGQKIGSPSEVASKGVGGSPDRLDLVRKRVQPSRED